MMFIITITFLITFKVQEKLKNLSVKSDCLIVVPYIFQRIIKVCLLEIKVNLCHTDPEQQNRPPSTRELNNTSTATDDDDSIGVWIDPNDRGESI